MTHRTHVSDEEIVMLMDGELGGRARVTVERHMAECVVCDRRRRVLVVAGEGVGRVFTDDRGRLEGRGRALRARVRGGIQRAGEERRMEWWRVGLSLSAVTVVVAGLGVYRWSGDGMAEPDRRLTPGAVRGIAATDLCREGGADFDPELPVSVRRAVFRKYGMSEDQAGGYQVDYLVSPPLGGTDAIENLWPEPYGVREWNARAKDALELRLRQMVCAGQLDLGSAQEAIRVDWIGAYRKYVGGSVAQ